MCLPFISSSCLIALAGAFSMALNWSSSERRPPLLFSVLGRWCFSVQYHIAGTLHHVWHTAGTPKRLLNGVKQSEPIYIEIQITLVSLLPCPTTKSTESQEKLCSVAGYHFEMRHLFKYKNDLGGM